MAVGSPRSKRLSYAVHRGEPGAVEGVVERVARDETRLLEADGMEPVQSDRWTTETEPERVVTAVKHPDDGTVEVRYDNVVRNKPSANGEPGRVNAKRTQACARDVANRRRGRAVPDRAERHRRREARAAIVREREESAARQMLLEVEGEYGRNIAIHLLERSGLVGNRVERDLNVLEDSVTEAARHLRDEGLRPALDRHFRLDGLSTTARDRQADGCVTAALLIMNAAMLHQRITVGGWLRDVPPLSEIKSAPDVLRRIIRAWQKITRQDFRPVVEPAIEAIEAAEDTGRLGGLERALRHLAAEAERIAEAYADMGADHAGPLFNRVMGNQASDGAYFTRPPAAIIAARLAVDAYAEDTVPDWPDPNAWRDQRAVDLACGSGTLLAALLTEMKQRAKAAGADERQLAELQRIAVEETIKGLDINPVSLQLAATQLTASNRDVKYRRMGLYQMPYGPTGDYLVPVAAGTLELLTDDSVLRRAQMDLLRRTAKSHVIRLGPEILGDPEVGRSAEAVIGARIVIMNPPYTERERMGQKYPGPVQLDLRRRVDSTEAVLVAADPELEDFVSKRSLRPLFVALADRCLDREHGVLAMVAPTIALTNHSGVTERRVLADRFHVHTVLTCHQPNNINLSQHTSINESIIILRRYPNGPKPPTRIINLDRLPTDSAEVDALFSYVDAIQGGGSIGEGWGEVSEWPAQRFAEGDWSAAIWRSPGLAEAAAHFAKHEDLRPIRDSGMSCHLTSPSLAVSHRRSTAGAAGAFPVLMSKGADGQKHIEAIPDEHWVHKKDPANTKVLEKAAHLLVSGGQRNSTARLTAVASDRKYVGGGWMPVLGVSRKTAKAVAVFLNSTVGRLLVMSNPGKTLAFPTYRPAVMNALPIPDLTDPRIRNTLANCWYETYQATVPQYRDGECKVRQIWDAAVCDALGWDFDEITSLRRLLHAEPHVSGIGYGQYR